MWGPSWDNFDFLKDPVQRDNFENYGFYSAPFVDKDGNNFGKTPT